MKIEELSRKMKERGINQRHLARLLGRSRSTYDNWKRSGGVPSYAVKEVENLLGKTEVGTKTSHNKIQKEIRGLRDKYGGYKKLSEISGINESTLKGWCLLDRTPLPSYLKKLRRNITKYERNLCKNNAETATPVGLPQSESSIAVGLPQSESSIAVGLPQSESSIAVAVRAVAAIYMEIKEVWKQATEGNEKPEVIYENGEPFLGVPVPRGHSAQYRVYQ